MSDLSLHKNARRLRIYISESDRWRGKPLDAALLETLKTHGLAGATAYRGIAGFGAHTQIHTAAIEVLSFDLPIIIEVIDTPEKIAAILETIYPMVREGLITSESLQIVKYTHRFLNPLPADRLVSEVMTGDVITLTADLTVYAAWKKMLETRIKAMPVVDSKRQVLGLLTDEDLLERAGVQQRLSVAIRMDAAEINQELSLLEESILSVADVMTTPVVTALAGETLGVATARMVKAGLKRLPVVDARGSLVGMLSRLDILRQIADTRPLEGTAQPPLEAVKSLGQVMRADIPTVSQDDDLPTMVEKFSRHDSHRLIVIDAAGKPAGLISDSDIVSRVQPARRRSILEALRQIGKPPLGKETARDLMSPGVLTAAPHLSISEAAQLMLSTGRKWLVVVDETGKPLGLVDRQILLEAIASVYPGENPA
jgi:CBS-domain-containing membrane protein/PII-like signaling protein